ncbi:alpha/beta-hydrolase [Wilcoxina mikolae CBS 423.85]|nr:alpha/beta-hydrolase [Wilcoxina mikolae CBS 423.85]
MGSHILLWRSPTIRKPCPPLPAGVERCFLDTPGGKLELLTSLPPQRTGKPPLLFVHGGFGSAQCYRNYLPYFSSRGYPAYAVSLRGHGESWQPGFWRMFFTPRQRFVEDIVAVARMIRKQEGEVVLVGHSSGGGCIQDLVSQGLEPVAGLVLLAAIPGSGSFYVNCNWWRLDSWFFPRFFWHLCHPRSPLSSTPLVKAAFFSHGFPEKEVRKVEAMMSEWESMAWPNGMMWRFVDPKKVVARMRRMLVVAGEVDALMSVMIERELAEWYRKAGGNVEDEVVRGAGHHLMLDTTWEEGARTLDAWLERG